MTREALFTAAVTRHFFRPFQRRYRARYFDTAYKQMVCGWGSTVKALASVDGNVRNAMLNAGKGTADGQGQTPATLDEMVVKFATGRGLTAGWREDRSLTDFLRRIRDWRMVEHGLSDDPVNVATYRDGDTIPRSSHIQEAARVRYPSKVSQRDRSSDAPRLATERVAGIRGRARRTLEERFRQPVGNRRNFG